MKDIKTTLGERLRYLREDGNFSRSAFAELMEVSPTMITEYEKGNKSPDLNKLVFIAKFFDTSIDYLLGLTEVRKSLTGNSSDNEKVNLTAFTFLDYQVHCWLSLFEKCKTLEIENEVIEFIKFKYWTKNSKESIKINLKDKNELSPEIKQAAGKHTIGVWDDIK